MTFTEAAAHVLRLVGKPLHYKEITDVAIEKDLLSHVGKSPEVTMGARLAAVVKKDQKDNPLIRVKPGVFALRDWDQGLIDAGLSDRTPALERLANLEAKGETFQLDESADEGGSTAPDESDEDGELAAEGEEEEEDIGEDERVRAELAATATDIFTPEDDDDEPILGGDSETEASERPGDAGGKRRRRRRRRGGRSNQGEDEGLPSYTVSDAPIVDTIDDEDAAPLLEADAVEREPSPPPIEGLRPERERGERGGERGERHRRGRDRDRGDRERGGGERGAGERGAGERERPAPERERSDAGELERSERDDESPLAEGDVRRTDDLTPASVLALLEQILPSFSRQGSAPIKVLAEQAQRRGRLRADSQALQDAILDAVRSEFVRARYERRRSRFRLSGRSVSLTEWGLDSDVVRLERDLFGVSERHIEAFQRSFGRRLQELGSRALTDFFSLLLGQIGFVEIRPVKRAGAHNQEVHLAAVARSPAGDIPTAIIVRRDGRDIGRERIIELRGALHHYGGAHAGLLATTGQVLSGAREEARAQNAAPVALLDGLSLAKLATQHGLGVNWIELRVPTLDLELFEALKNG
jgi:HB1/ASXL restriction endonuclease-like protein with HTH domain/restriction endonuclease